MTIHITIIRMDPYGHDQQMTRFMTRFIISHIQRLRRPWSAPVVSTSFSELTLARVDASNFDWGSDSCNMAVLSLEASGQYEAKKLQVGKCISLLR